MNETIDWLEHASTLCGFCLGPSSVEFELYCVECDRAACAFCMVRSPGGSRAIYCPECAVEARADEASPSAGGP